MIDHLPEKYRQVITLSEYDGLNQREISEQLGMSFFGSQIEGSTFKGQI